MIVKISCILLVFVYFFSLNALSNDSGYCSLSSITGKKNKADCENKIYIPSARLRLKLSKKKNTICYKPQIQTIFYDLARDAIRLNLNLISWDTFKVVASIFPFYVATRMGDEKLQRCFYDECCHKNKTQLPHWCHDLACYSLAIPIIYFGTRPFLSYDIELQEAGRIFLLGMPIVIFSKDIIKQFDFDACLRPWNEKFSRHKRAGGGFPSGHMAEAAYIAVLFGMRFGPKYAIPLGLMAAFIGVTFLNCNRHYASQLIAGVGFGALYAIAANKLIDTKINERITMQLSMQNCRPALSCSYNF